MAPSMTEPITQRLPESGIKVIIVGAGFAGLTAAIECQRKGHDVIVLESFPELKILGDIISFAANSGRIFQRWPGVEAKLDPICHKSGSLQYNTWKGEYLFTQYWEPEERAYGKAFNGHRGEIHEILYEYAKSIGVDIRLGHKVDDYFEDEEKAGVVCANGERLEADVVIGADGARSKARTIVLGYEDKPKSSGYAVYRAWFPSGELANDPDVKWMVENGDKHCAWLGPDIHFIAASIKGGKDFSWVCTHKDEADVEESWQAYASPADAAKVIEGWDPVCHKIVNATPFLIDWKLVYRDPLPTWISAHKRIAIIGDAAHPFLPTSIQGASQSMEDGVTVAVCLALGGKANVQDSVAAFEALRYDRVKAAQKTGETTRDTWHKADFEKVKQDPESMRLKRDPWLLDHDAESYAEENYAKTVAALGGKKGTEALPIDGRVGAVIA